MTLAEWELKPLWETGFPPCRIHPPSDGVRISQFVATVRTERLVAVQQMETLDTEPVAR